MSFPADILTDPSESFPLKIYVPASVITTPFSSAAAPLPETVQPPSDRKTETELDSL